MSLEDKKRAEKSFLIFIALALLINIQLSTGVEDSTLINNTLNNSFEIQINETINQTQIQNLTNAAAFNETSKSLNTTSLINQTNLTNETINQTQALNETNLTQPEKTIAISLDYKSGSIYDANDNGEESINGVIDMTVEGTKFSWDADEAKVCTRWKVYPIDSGEANIICYGAEKCCNFVELMPSRQNWSGIFYMNYGLYGATYNNTISAQVLYIDYNLSIEKPYAEIYYSSWENLTARFREVVNITEPISEPITNDTDTTIVSKAIKQHNAVIGKPVKWELRIKYSNLTKINITLPKIINFSTRKIVDDEEIEINKKGIKVKKDNIVKTANEFELDKVTGYSVRIAEGTDLFSRFLNWLFSRLNAITGYSIIDVKESNETELIIEEPIEEIEVEYYTEAPVAVEEETASGKKITVSSELSYTDILTFASIPEAPSSIIKLYWHASEEDYKKYINDEYLIIGDGRKIKIDITYQTYFAVSFADENSNGLIETVYWTTPHTSSQEFEISIIILNVQSYPTVGGNWTVAFNTTGTGNLTISASNGTTYSEYFDDNPTTANDLDILELKCNENVLFNKNDLINKENVYLVNGNNEKIKLNETLSQSIAIKSLYAENYNCSNLTGYYTVHVITKGKHVQQFNFSGQTAYANNFALDAGFCDGWDLTTTCWVNTTKYINGTYDVLSANNLFINASGRLVNDTLDTTFFINLTGNLTIQQGGGIFLNASSCSSGSCQGGGNLTIIANVVNLSGTIKVDGGGTTASALGHFSGNGGVITINASSILIGTNAEISASSDYVLSTTNAHSGGNAGTISLNATLINNTGIIRAVGGTGDSASCTLGSSGRGERGSGGKIIITSQVIEARKIIATNGPIGICNNKAGGAVILNSSSIITILNEISVVGNVSGNITLQAKEIYLNSAVLNATNETGSTTGSNGTIKLLYNVTINASLATIKPAPIIIKENEFGRVEFFNRISGFAAVDLNKSINITNNSISVNPEGGYLNTSAGININGILLNDFVIVRDGLICPSSICTLLSSISNIVSFNVTQFSTYLINPSLNVSINLNTSANLVAYPILVSGHLNFSNGTNLADVNVSIFRNNTLLNVSITTSEGNYNFTFAAPEFGTYEIKANATSGILSAEKSAALAVFSPLVIHNVYTVPKYPKKNDNVTFIANLTVNDTEIMSVNFTLINPNGTKVLDNVNGSRNSTIPLVTELWNVTFNVSAYGTWLWNVSGFTTSGYIQNTTTQEIVLMEVTESLNASSVLVNTPVSIFGHINLSNGTNVSNNNADLFISGQKMNQNNSVVQNASNFASGSLTALTLLADRITLTANGSSQYPVQSGVFLSDIINVGPVHRNFTLVSWGENISYDVEIGRAPNDGNNASYFDGFINTSGLVLLMHFNNETGENDSLVKDYSRDINSIANETNNGTCSGTTCPIYNFSDKKFGKSSMSFDGTDDYITVSNSSIFDFNDNDFTIELWAKWKNTTGNQIIIEKFTGSTGPGWSFYKLSNLLEFYGCSNSRCIRTSTTILNTNVWYHIVVTRLGSTFAIYRDGINIGTSINANALTNSTTPLLIGTRNTNSLFFNGSIDEVAIWNRSLSSDEIRNLYQRNVLKLNLSVRSCDDSACSGENFSEVLGNSSGTRLNVSITPNNPYFQYKATLSTSYFNFTPSLYNVTINYTALATDGYGSYNFTFKTPSSAGTYSIKVNITTDIGIPGEQLTTLAVNAPAEPSKAAVTAVADSSGGDSGGIAVPSNEAAYAARRWDVLPSGESATLTINNEGIAITSVVVDIKRLVINADLKVASLVSTPYAASPAAKVYQYLELTKANIFNEDASAIKINFKVPKSWMSSNNIEKSDILLYRHSEGKWNPLPTAQTGADANNVLYQAITPGFSIFAIGTSPIINESIGLPIESKEEMPLMDLKIEIPHEYLYVSQGKEVRADISITNLGNIPVHDAMLYYGLQLQNGTVINQEEEYISITDKLLINRKINVPHDLPQGTYLFYGRLNYKDNAAVGLDIFNVTERPFKVKPRFVILLIALISLLLIAAAATSFFRQQPEKRFRSQILMAYEALKSKDNAKAREHYIKACGIYKTDIYKKMPHKDQWNAYRLLVDLHRYYNLVKK
ncbi:PGF-pre-PGF domain-containing protein [Candidatus Woesearchaeota archaeon]|nr:PGF-pre-PGF domain-containing protein [Candidatus Woesearchaeota archaeon]